LLLIGFVGLFLFFVFPGHILQVDDGAFQGALGHFSRLFLREWRIAQCFQRFFHGRRRLSSACRPSSLAAGHSRMASLQPRTENWVMALAFSPRVVLSSPIRQASPSRSISSPWRPFSRHKVRPASSSPKLARE